ncbi:MAG: hypothetical protein JSW55_08190, partial [Chloroflexota bacterium]
MKTKMNKRMDLLLLMVLVFILSACGTLKIDAETAASQIEPAATATPITRPAPTPGEAMATATQIVEAIPTQAIEITTIVTIEPASSEVAVKATAGPFVLVDYNDEQTGISFYYPAGWTLEEEANTYLFHNGTLTLHVKYRMDGETADLWNRTGIP